MLGPKAPKRPTPWTQTPGGWGWEGGEPATGAACSLEGKDGSLLREQQPEPQPGGGGGVRRQLGNETLWSGPGEWVLQVEDG